MMIDFENTPQDDEKKTESFSPLQPSPTPQNDPEPPKNTWGSYTGGNFTVKNGEKASEENNDNKEPATTDRSVLRKTMPFDSNETELPATSSKPSSLTLEPEKAAQTPVSTNAVAPPPAVEAPAPVAPPAASAFSPNQATATPAPNMYQTPPPQYKEQKVASTPPPTSYNPPQPSGSTMPYNAGPQQAPPSPYAQPPQAPPSPYAQPPQAPPSPYAQPPQAPPSPYAQPPQAPPSPYAQPPQAPPAPFPGTPQYGSGYSQNPNPISPYNPNINYNPNAYIDSQNRKGRNLGIAALILEVIALFALGGSSGFSFFLSVIGLVLAIVGMNSLPNGYYANGSKQTDPSAKTQVTVAIVLGVVLACLSLFVLVIGYFYWWWW